MTARERCGARKGLTPVRGQTGRVSGVLSRLTTTPDAGMRWLRWVLLVAPAVLILALMTVRPHVHDLLGLEAGFAAMWTALAILALAFGLVMFVLLGKADAAIVRRNHELAQLNTTVDAVNALLLQVSRHEPLDETLSRISDTARTLLGADRTALLLNSEAGALAGTGRHPHGCGRTDKLACAASSARSRRDGLHGCPQLHPTRWGGEITRPLVAGDRTIGEIWVGRRSRRPFSDADRALLDTLVDAAVTAVEHARLLAAQRHGAALTERDRIARELHDSLAQVLGVTHLRLRGISQGGDLASAAATREVTELAELCHEAYQDVREAILGLREGNRVDRTLIENLTTYVATFSRTSGVETSLACSAGNDLRLSPAAEVQLIRVIQEALTNVRKHSGATRASVTISEDPEHVMFAVTDNGQGFAQHLVAGDGFGLSIMRERAESVHGRLRIRSRPGDGTVVQVAIPRHQRITPFDEELSA